MANTPLTPRQTANTLDKDAKAITDTGLVPVLLQRARVLMQKDVRENFQASKDPDGQPWKPLKFPRVRGGDKPLLDTGLLRASVTTKAEGNIEQYTATSVTIGTNRPGANLHQKGGTVLPVKAKALAIPLTKEALRSGGPRNFPRSLTMLWKPGANSGVLAEVNQAQLRVSKQEKNLRKQTAKLVPRKREFMARIKRLQGEAKKAKTQAKRRVISKRIEAEYGKLREYESRVAGNVRKRESMASNRKRKAYTLQFALVKSVTVPARPYVGFGRRLLERLDNMFAETAKSYYAGRLPSQQRGTP